MQPYLKIIKPTRQWFVRFKHNSLLCYNVTSLIVFECDKLLLTWFNIFQVMLHMQTLPSGAAKVSIVTYS
jgi:hypothetical protein